MMRTILKLDQNNLTLTLPDELVGKLIEVYAFEIKEGAQEVQPVNQRPKPSQLRGFLSKESSELMHEHINQSRAEWGTL